jgi:hypothetical protein
MFIKKNKEETVKESQMVDAQNVLADPKNALDDDALEHVAGGGCFNSFYEDDRKERFGDWK